MTPPYPPSRARARAALFLAVLGVLIAVGAAAALGEAGRYTANTFRPGLRPRPLAHDRGAAASIALWAVPLGVAGLATLVVAVGAAVQGVRADIAVRRAALLKALPRVLGPVAR